MRKSALFERTGNRWLTITRILGALFLLVIGGVHYQQYRYEFYSAIPTIGPLFLLNFISAGALGLLLLVPGKSRLGRRGILLDELAALSGIAVAAGGFVALLISEQTPLFGFMEHGYRFAIVLAIVSDVAAMVLLAGFLACARASARGRGDAQQRERSSTRSTDKPLTPPTATPVTEN